MEDLTLTERANAGLHTHIEDKISTLGLNKEASILDVGAGTGSFLFRLKKAGYVNLCGVDIAKPNVEIRGVSFFEFDLDTGAMGSMPFSVELDITGICGLARLPGAAPAAMGWMANA